MVPAQKQLHSAQLYNVMGTLRSSKNVKPVAKKVAKKKATKKAAKK